jgi:hypothetical protein
MESNVCIIFGWKTVLMVLKFSDLFSFQIEKKKSAELSEMKKENFKLTQTIKVII